MKNRLVVLFVIFMLPMLVGLSVTYAADPRLDAERHANLLEAAKEGNSAEMRRLFDEGANVEAKDDFGYTSLHRSNYGYTPLHLAVAAGHKDIVVILLGKNANVNAKNMSGGWTPLHFAAYEGNVEMARLLIKNGASVDAKNNIEMTPLHYAASWGRIEVLKLLLAEGADINNKNCIKDTPLHAAAREGHIGVVSLLLDKGADVVVNARDNRGDTPLQCATYSGKCEIVKLLLIHGADGHNISLHHAAQWGYPEVLKLLLTHGADANSANDRGETPLQLARICIYLDREGKSREKRSCGSITCMD